MHSNLLAQRGLYDTQKLELTEEIRKMLKKSGQYSDFADYFIALEYLWNLVDNDLGFELNQRIGFEMLCAFLRADNEYAFSYFIYGIVATGQSSQFVDDDLRELL